MSFRSVVILSVGVSCLLGPAAAASSGSWSQVADSQADFSNVQGANGWSYGFAVGFGAPAPVSPMKNFSENPGCGCGNVGPIWHFAPSVCFCGAEFCFQGATIAHPDSHGEPHVPVRGYTFPTSGRYLLQPSFFHAGGCQAAEDIRLELRLRGQVLWSAETDGGAQAGSIEVVAAAGERAELWSMMLLGECGGAHEVRMTVSRAPGSVLVVSQSGPADFTTIQSAYDAAADGDIVLVLPGTYAVAQGPVLQTSGKRVRVMSRDGAAATVIDASGRCCALATEALPVPLGPADQVIEGFTVTGSVGTAAIVGSVTFRDCVFSANSSVDSATPSAARVAIGRSAIFDGCRFIGNGAAGPGGFSATASSDAATVRFVDCSFESNVGGSATIVAGASALEFDGCSFVGNSSGIGAIGQFGGSLVMEDCLVQGNTGSGIGAMLQGGACIVRRSTFRGNQALGGGTIRIDNGGDPSSLFEDCLFEDNVSSQVGGALDIWCSGPVIRRCGFEGNRAVGGGAIFLGGQQGCLFQTLVEDSTFEGNEAVSSEPWPGPGSHIGSGGAIRNNLTYLAMTRCILRDNVATNIGGGLSKWLGSSAIASCSFRDNLAGLDGGGASFAGDLQSVSSTSACGNGPNDFAGSWTDLGGNRVGPVACACLADLNSDGTVNGADLGLLIAFWGPVTTTVSPSDLNGDGTVNGADLGALLASWGPCGN